MGWKTLKEHYRIGHYVHVTSEGICIGSPYIHNLMIVGLDGVIKKPYDGTGNEDLKRYQSEMEADPAKLREVVMAADTFKESIPVYTYEGPLIIEKRCEKPGWPNVTHDGAMMYENTFSTDRNKVIERARSTAKAEVRWASQMVDQCQKELSEARARLEKSNETLAMLEASYPTPSQTQSSNPA